MKTIIAIVFATSVCLLSGCASRGGDGGAGSTANTGGSGITVFGTIDAGVSNYKNQSR